MRKRGVALCLFALFLIALLTACGSSDSIHITSNATANTSDAGAPVTLSATGAQTVTFALTSTTCPSGTVTPTSATTAVFTPPANTITSDCTATITASSSTNPSLKNTITLTIKAITVSGSSSAGNTTTFNSGGAPVTLTGTLNNDPAANGDVVNWSISSTTLTPAVRKARLLHPSIIQDANCGTLSATQSNSGQGITYTPPTVTAACTATITASSNINGNHTQWIFTVIAPASQLFVTPLGTTPETAGTPFNVTVTATDDNGNTVTGYTGTVHFTSTDGAAVLPANTTLTNGTGSFNATLKTAGTQTITATDTVTSSITGTTGSLVVSPGAAASFTFSNLPGSSVIAGNQFGFTITAYDAYNNQATNYGGTVHFTSSDTQAASKGSLPADTTLTNGTGNFNAILVTSGTQTLTVTDKNNGAVTGTSAGITIVDRGADHLVFTTPASVPPNQAFNFTLTALDVYNNLAIDYTGTVHFTSTDVSATLPANYTFVSGDKGSHSFSATMPDTGTQTITAQDTNVNWIAGTSNAINVALNPATHFSVTAPSTASAGSSFQFTVQALDATNSPTSGYSGTVHFTSSDTSGFATLPANATLTNGAGTFNATLAAQGNQTITATDTVTASITGTSGNINVGPGVATQLVVSAPTTATAGSAITFAVTAKDTYGNTASGYTGTVAFSSTDNAATLPANYTFVAGDNGSHTFTNGATLNTTGNQTITATDSGNSLQGTSGSINVSTQSASILINPDQKNYGVVGQAYFVGINVQGGTPPYTFSTSNGTLPPGLSFSATDQSLEGTPTTAGSYPFTVKVTDSTNAFNTADVTVTIAAAPAGQNNSWLNGRYSCLMKAYQDNNGTPYPTVSISSIPFSGGSSFSGASFDFANAGGTSPGVLVSGTATGTVNIGSDNHGILTFTPTINGQAQQTATFAIVANNLTAKPANEFHGVQIDDILPNPSGQHGEVSCYLQSSPFAPGNGINLAFEASGFGGNITSPSSIVGVLTNFSSGTFAGGESDSMDPSGVKTAEAQPAGTYTTPNSTTGLFEIVIPKNGTPHTDVWVMPIDATRGLMLVVKDAQSGSVGDVESGRVAKQAHASFSNSNLSGAFVLNYEDTAYDSSGNVLAYASNLLQGSGNGSSSMTVNHLFQDSVQVISGQSQSPQFGDQFSSPQTFPVTVASNGRAAFAPDPTSSNEVFLYFYDTNSAFIMDSTQGIGVGIVEPQSSTSTPGSSSGTKYMEYDLPSQDPSAGDQSGLITLTTGSTNTFAGAIDKGEEGSYRWAQPINDGGATPTYGSADAKGVVVVNTGGSTPLDCVTISSSKLGCIDSNDHPTVHILQK